MNRNRPIRLVQGIGIALLSAVILAVAIARIPSEKLLPTKETLDSLLYALGATLLLAAGLTILAALRRSSVGGPPRRERVRVALFRAFAVGTILLSLRYMSWRLLASIEGAVLWVAIPLVVAEIYALVDTLFLTLMMWRPSWRVSPEPLDGATVDVFIATINEPVELLRLTAEAAMRIDWKPLSVHILDDGGRPEVATLAEELGCNLITRGDAWSGKPRHAKAGNVNNALDQTTGEFILILDADQIPTPRIVERIVGYFRDPKVAFVQTPQEFYNLPPGDPFGSDAPLFYGPILRGKDGWNAAFFCGSNGMLRREALLQLGLLDYARASENALDTGLAGTERALRKALRRKGGFRDAPLGELHRRIDEALAARRQGASLQEVADRVEEAVRRYRKASDEAGFAELTTALQELASQGDEAAGEARLFLEGHLPDVVSALGSEEWREIETLADRSFTRSDEAMPLQPLATTSITEDMATSVRLHSLGWRSVYHAETLAYGLAPEDLGTALKQRLRWAQGTIQVLLREKPLTRGGLSLPQRLQYFTTIYSYFSGFASVLFLCMPIIYLFTGIAPVNAWTAEFLWRLVPYLLMSRLLFKMFALGTRIRRGEQYNLGLFPLWIRAVIGALFGKKLSFTVTSKVRQSGNYLKMVRPQLLVMLLSAGGVAYGTFGLANGWDINTAGVLVNIFWAVYNIILLSAIVRAAVYRPPADFRPLPPAEVRS